MKDAAPVLISGALYALILVSWAGMLWLKLNSFRARFIGALALFLAGALGVTLAREGTTHLVLTCAAPIQLLLYPFAWPSADSRLVHWGVGTNALATVGLALCHSLG